MTRSTNMKHVEVLREMWQQCANDRRMIEADALDAAIASLSAPQPPAEAQPVYAGVDLEGGWIRATAPTSAPDYPITATCKVCDYDYRCVPVPSKCGTCGSDLPPSAPVGVEGAPIRYFAYDSDCGDYNEFDTLPEAIADAQEALDYAGDDGWPEGGPSIYYGAVLGEAREVEGSRRPAGPGDHPDADFIVEYELTGSDALSHQPAAVASVGAAEDMVLDSIERREERAPVDDSMAEAVRALAKEWSADIEASDMSARADRRNTKPKHFLRDLEELLKRHGGQRDALNAWRAAFITERATRYRERGMSIEQARIHAEIDAALMDKTASQSQGGGRHG